MLIVRVAEGIAVAGKLARGRTAIAVAEGSCRPRSFEYVRVADHAIRATPATKAKVTKRPVALTGLGLPGPRFPAGVAGNRVGLG